jgi:hypothetical protein
MDIYDDIDNITKQLVKEGHTVRTAGIKLLRILMMNVIPNYKGHTERALGKYYGRTWRLFSTKEHNNAEEAIEALCAAIR